MSVSDENAVTPNCPTCGDTTPRGVVCLTCQPFPEVHRCQVCERRGPRPGEIVPPPSVEFLEPDQLPIPITPIAIDATYVPSETPLPGRYRSWITEHDRDHVTITHGTTRMSVTMLNHDLSRSEREAMIPKLVDAIERIIDEAEGG